MQMDLSNIVVGSALLCLAHVLIPVHWFPTITISKAEKWSCAQTLFAGFVVSFSHMLATVGIGICIGLLGYKLSSFMQNFAITVSAAILIILGLYYIISEFINSKYKIDLCHHCHHHQEPRELKISGKRYSVLLSSLAVAGFLTPCLELETYYLSAGFFGLKGIFAVSAVYMLCTIPMTVLLVYLGFVANSKVKLDFFEKYEHQIIGTIMMLVGLSLFVID